LTFAVAQFEKATVAARLAAPTPAELVLLDLGIDSPADIDLEAIAWTLGARVRYRPLDSCCVGKDDQAIITINCRSSSRRQRLFARP
jgi:hypothetical protein